MVDPYRTPTPPEDKDADAGPRWGTSKWKRRAVRFWRWAAPGDFDIFRRGRSILRSLHRAARERETMHYKFEDQMRITACALELLKAQTSDVNGEIERRLKARAATESGGK